MFSTLTPSTTKKPPGYDLNTIFRPYTNEPAGNCGKSNDTSSPIKSKAGKRSLFSIELSRFPNLAADEPLMSWLLRAANIVPDLVMRDALDVASKGGPSPHEILRLAGRVSHSDLRALERAEAYVQNGILYRDFAVIALEHALANFIEFDDALWDLNLHPNDPFGDSKLFELLDDCAMLPHADLLAIRRECLSSGVTIGFALMRNGLMSGQLLKVLLECLAAVASKKLQYHDLVLTVISIIRDTDTIYSVTDSRAITHEARLVAQVPISTSDRALGNLIMCSGLMELEDLIFCLDVALEDNRSLGVVIADFMLVDPVLLQAARGLAYMLCEKKLTARRSVELLEEVKNTGMPLAQIFSDGNSLTVVNGGAMAQAPISSIA